MKAIRGGYYKGATGQVCVPHKTGVSVGTPPFFDPTCPRCKQKLAEGKVTGTEPHPSLVIPKRHRQYRRGWALATSTQGIAKREGLAAARAHVKGAAW